MNTPEINTKVIADQKAIAERFIARAKAMGYKGVKRDAAALDYFVGAAIGAELAGNQPLANSLKVLATLIIGVHGYIGVKEIAIAG